MTVGILGKQGAGSSLAPNATEIASELSHELRTPLTAIQAVLDLLGTGRLGTLSQQGQRMVAIAANNADRLLRVTVAIEQEPNAQILMLSAVELAQLRLETDLQAALARQEFQLYYQPIVSLTEQCIIGFEALLRWQHPTLGWVSPEQFIPLAEAMGIISEIGVWVLQQACEQLSNWQQAFPDWFGALHVSVNLSGKQLSQLTIAQQIEQILQTTGLAAASLKLEITESAMLDNAVVAQAALSHLQQMGVEVYMDDFGTGYSSLTRLSELPLNVLKIDRAFVQQMESPKGNQLVKAIANFAHSIGAEIIAEGVETCTQADILKNLGCDRAQGYLFAHPMDSHTLLKFVPFFTYESCTELSCGSLTQSAGTSHPPSR